MTQSASDLIKSRISTRAFLPDPISEAEIRAILDIAKFAPSGGNLQPWKVHVVTGAARGIGAATAKRLHAEGNRLVADLIAAELQKLDVALVPP